MPARVETVALLSQNCGVEISKNTPVWREGQFSAFAKTSRRTNHHRLSLCRTCGIVLANTGFPCVENAGLFWHCSLHLGVLTLRPQAKNYVSVETV